MAERDLQMAACDVSVSVWGFLVRICLFLSEGQLRWGQQPSEGDRDIKLKVEGREEEHRAMGRSEDEMIKNLIKWAVMKRKRLMGR